MKKQIIIVFFATLLFCSVAEDINIQVNASPELPVKNLLLRNSDFEEDLAGWRVGDANKEKVSIVTDSIKGGKSLKLTDKANIFRMIDLKNIMTTGKSYIGSCMILPGKEVTTHNSGNSGLGFSFVFRNGKTARAIICRGAGAPQWQKIVSSPCIMPEDATSGELTVGLAYTRGSGLVDDIKIQEAYSQMNVQVTAKENIRQVKIMNDLGKTIFDSGVLAEKKKSFQKELKVETPYIYTIMTISEDGDVKSIKYPEINNDSITEKKQ